MDIYSHRDTWQVIGSFKETEHGIDKIFI
jgi:hypothetical protein